MTEYGNPVFYILDDSNVLSGFNSLIEKKYIDKLDMTVPLCLQVVTTHLLLSICQMEIEMFSSVLSHITLYASIYGYSLSGHCVSMV